MAFFFIKKQCVLKANEDDRVYCYLKKSGFGAVLKLQY